MKKLDFSLLFIMCALWAGNYFVSKDVLDFVDPITFSFLRALLGGIFLLPFGGYALKGLPGRTVGILCLVGLFNVSVFFVLLYLGLTTVKPGIASTLVYTQPVIVVVLSPLIGESLSYRKIIGILAAFVGVALIFLSSFSGFTLVIGDLLVLGSSLAWSVSILLYKRWRVQANSRVVPTIQLLAGSAFILPVLALEKPFLDPTLTFWVYLLYNVVLATGFGYVLFWGVLSRMPASELTSYLFLVPVLTIVIGSVISLSIPTWFEVGGTLLVALGIVAANR